MSRPPNHEFQEWWNRERLGLLSADPTTTATASSDGSAATATPTTPISAGKSSRHQSARQISFLLRLRILNSLSSLLSLPLRFFPLLCSALRRSSPSDSSRLYRVIRGFLLLSLLLLVLELAAYSRGWHFAPPSYSSSAHALELLYARWLYVRANYLAPPLQTMTNVCIVLFLIQSVDRIVLMLGCLWIKVRGIKPVPKDGYYDKDDVEEGLEYPMVLLQIPMCNEREV